MKSPGSQPYGPGILCFALCVFCRAVTSINDGAALAPAAEPPGAGTLLISEEAAPVTPADVFVGLAGIAEAPSYVPEITREQTILAPAPAVPFTPAGTGGGGGSSTAQAAADLSSFAAASTAKILSSLTKTINLGPGQCTPQIGSSNGCNSGILGDYARGFCTYQNLQNYDFHPAVPEGVAYIDMDRTATLYGSSKSPQPGDVQMGAYTTCAGLMASMIAWTLRGGSGARPPTTLLGELGKDAVNHRSHVAVFLYNALGGLNEEIVNSLVPVDANGNNYINIDILNGCRQKIVWPDLVALAYATSRGVSVDNMGGARPDDAITAISGVTQLWLLGGRGEGRSLEEFASTLLLSVRPGGVPGIPYMSVMTTYNTSDLPSVGGFYNPADQIMSFLGGGFIFVENGYFVVQTEYGDEFVLKPNWAYAMSYAGVETYEDAQYDMYDLYNPLGHNRPTDFLSAPVPNPLRVPVTSLFYAADVIITTHNAFD